jgi:methyltransferase (TIGR00027 family)
MLSGVSQTALITLRARVEEHERSDRVFADPVAAKWWSHVTWPKELDRWSAKTRYVLAFRADDIDRLLAHCLHRSPSSAVIELGAGLSTRRHRLSLGSGTRWVDVDLPEVVALRRSFGETGEHLDSSVLDYSWMDRLALKGPAVFIAEGLLYYLPRVQVDSLFEELRRRYPGSAIIFDLVGSNDYATMLDSSSAVGSPIAWALESDYGRVLEQFGLETIDGLDPDALSDAALMRYWDRFDAQMQGAIYFVMSSELLRRGRSGTVLGELKPL